MTHAEAVARYQSFAARVADVDRLRWARANEASGLGAYRNVWGNAMIAHKQGKGWQGVDYAKLRLAIRIDASRDALWRLRDRYWETLARKVT